MGFKLREIGAESKFCRELTLAAVAQAVPMAEVQAALAETGVCEQRERKLNMLVTVLVTIAMNLYSRASIGEVMRKLAQGLRYIWPDLEYQVPDDSAISQRRYQLGARPLVALFHRVCQPLATPETAGAFLFARSDSLTRTTTAELAGTVDNWAQPFYGDPAYPSLPTRQSSFGETG